MFAKQTYHIPKGYITIKATPYEVAFYYFGGAGGAAVGISLPKPTDRYTTKIR